MWTLTRSAVAGFACLSVTTSGQGVPDETSLPFEIREIRRDFGVGYAVAIADVNADERPDVIAINETQLVWFENPTWQMHVMLDGETPSDNVTIAPHDVDGDGRLDVAVGAAWNPKDTEGGGTLHWARQGDTPEDWTLHDVGSEPTLHRIGWADVDGEGPALVVTPLHGRGTSPPDWSGPGARVLLFRVPANPVEEPWPMEVADETLHILHHFLVTDLGGNGRDDLLTASREGVHALQRDQGGDWQRTPLGEGEPGEIALGRVGGRRVLATVEPWHGHSVVLYLEPEPSRSTGEAGATATRWPRRTIEEEIAGGHALGWADFNGDGDDELAVGWRDDEGGIAIYHVDREGTLISKTLVDDGGMAAEDLAIADLDGNGRPDLVASGRRTANVRIYWNRRDRPSR